MLLPAGSDPAAAILLLLAGLVGNLLIGGIRGLTPAMAWPDRLVAGAAVWLEARLNRPGRGAGDRLIRGLITTLSLAGAALILGAGLAGLARAVPGGDWLEAALIATALPLGASWAAARRVAESLDAGRADRARAALAPVVRAETEALDAGGLARLAAERVGCGLVRDLAGPIFWYLLLGLPGLLGARAVAACARTLGPRIPRLASFGEAARRLDLVIHWLPARLAGLMLGLGGLAAPTVPPAAALALLRRLGGVRPAWRPALSDPVGESAIAALAELAGLGLGGPVRIAGEPLARPWLGEGRAALAPRDLRRALILAQIATLIALLLVTLALLAVLN